MVYNYSLLPEGVNDLVATYLKRLQKSYPRQLSNDCEALSGICMLPILFISVSIKSKFCRAIFFNTALFFNPSWQRKKNISFSSHEGSSFFL